ncbi:MAG: hypothetical protein AAF602_13395 [Myxococcota bacterium]
MLDTYIIDQIRRDQERKRKDTRIPLHIEDRRPGLDEAIDHIRREPKRDERGSAIIDFKL